MSGIAGYNAKTKEFYAGGDANPCPPGGVGKALFDKFKAYAQLGYVAQVEGETGKEESYHSFLDRCVRIALCMKDEGVRQGDVVSVCSENSPHNCPVLFGAFFVGALPAFVDIKLSVDDARHLCALVEPKLIFVCEAARNLVRDAIADRSYRTKVVPLFDDDSADNLPTMMRRYSENDAANFRPVYVQDTTATAGIIFSSGTTGLAKGSLQTHDSLMADSRCFPRLLAPYLERTRRLCIFNTPYWVTAQVFTIYCFYFGYTRVSFRRLPVEDIWDGLARLKVNGAVISCYDTLQALKYVEPPMPDLLCIVFVGGPMALPYHNEMKRKLPDTKIYSGYGMSECGVVATLDDSNPEEFSYVPYPKDLTLKIVGVEDGAPLGLNELGEICVKCPSLIRGFHKLDSSALWDDDGFYKTGDMGYLNDACRLYVVDRCKEMFKYRGWRVAPAKIERALAGHPAVKIAVVVGIPDEQENCHAMGVVVLKDGHEKAVTDEALVEFVNGRMDDLHQIRAGVKFIDERQLRRNANGKVLRVPLRKLVS